MNQNDVEARIEKVLSRVKESISASIPGDVQEELGLVLGLFEYAKEPDKHHYLLNLEIAVEALLAEKPNIPLAKQIRERVESRVRKKLFSIRHPAVMVVFGLGMLLYIGIPLITILLPDVLDKKEVLGINTQLLIGVGIAGAVGSIVSIMVRIQDFSNIEGVELPILFFTGFFKPIIGVAFALFVFAAIQSEVIPIIVKQGNHQYFFLALAFISSFSERFAKDVVSKAEGHLASAGTNKPQ